MKNGKDFDRLLDAVTSETQEIMALIPDINTIDTDISQIYSDVEAYLIGCSTDITKLSPQEIEQTIKQINKASLQDETMKQYVGDDGYKIVNNEIIGNSVELLHKRYVENAMKKISEDIHELVQCASTMDKQEYLKRAVGLHYRFIRIHPFPNSNGRTARALLNMITIPKGILVNFDKELKKQYNISLNETNMEIDSKGYLQAIEENSEKLTDIETNTEIPLYKFVKESCIIQIENVGESDGEDIIRNNTLEEREI